MEQAVTNTFLYPQERLPFKPSNEIIGFEKATELLLFGIACILIVLIFGFILCRLDMSGDKRHRSFGIYVQQ